MACLASAVGLGHGLIRVIGGWLSSARLRGLRLLLVLARVLLVLQRRSFVCVSTRRGRRSLVWFASAIETAMI